jgi:hypothetical protein
MDLTFLLTGVLTVVLAVGGLILTCHLERRALHSRRRDAGRPPGGVLGGDGMPS